MSEGTIEVDANVRIPRSELQVRASRAGGPGGQHVNTSSTRIELVWNLATSTAVSGEQRARLMVKLASRLDATGALRIVASDRRSQQQNRAAAEERLGDIVRKALIVPKKRRPTKPTKASKERRITEKKRRGQTKRNRRPDFD